MGRAQVSLEYLVIVGIAIGLLVPAVMFFYSYNQSTEAASVGARINTIGLDMVAKVKGTFALGKGARQSLEVTFPENVKRIYVIGEEELVIEYETSAGLSHAVFFSNINMTTEDLVTGNVTDVHPGLTKFQFEAMGRNVTIRESE